MPKFIDFALVKKDIPFADAIDILDLKLKFAGNQWRGPCSACGGGMLVVTQGVAFHCKSSDVGGDQIALAKHILDLPTMRDAAFWLAEHAGSRTGTSTSKSTSRTVPESGRGERTQKPTPRTSREPEERQARAKASGEQWSFDPDEFWGKTTYTDEVADLGISEDQAEELRIGFYRGKLYQALRYADGKVAGYSSFANGELKMPTSLLPSNVVPFQKRA